MSLDGSSPTRFCREDVLIVEQVLDPGHDVINIGRCGEVDALSILIDPSVIEALYESCRSKDANEKGNIHLLWSSRHGRT